MNSLNFCGPSATAVYPLHGVGSMLLDLHQQMAEQYHVYSAGSPAAHSLSVAERLAGRSTLLLHRTQRGLQGGNAPSLAPEMIYFNHLFRFGFHEIPIFNRLPFDVSVVSMK